MAKTRTDSWSAKLTPDQQTELYRMATQSSSWEQTAQWAAKEFKLNKPPSQTAFYRWMRAMREEVRRQRLEDTAFAAAEAAALDKEAPRDETIIAALKARVLEAALAGNTRIAGELTRIADILHRHLVEEKKLALAERHLQLIEQEKAGEIKNLREEIDAAQEELKRSKKVPLVRNLRGGLPILPSRTNNEGTVSTEETEPASYPATSPRDPPPAAPPDDPY